MVVKCVVPHCPSNNDDLDAVHKDGHVSFHRFPDDPIVRAEWTSRSNREPGFEPSAWSRMCSRHFTPDCYKLDSEDKQQRRRSKRQNAQLATRILHDDAVPTIFDLHFHSCRDGECYKRKRKCVHCESFIAYSEKDMRDHLSAVHVGYLPLGCQHCLDKNEANWFATDESLEWHTVNEHPGLDAKAKSKPVKRKEAKLAQMMEEFESSKSTKARRAIETQSSGTGKSEVARGSRKAPKPRLQVKFSSTARNCRTLSAVRAGSKEAEADEYNELQLQEQNQPSAEKPKISFAQDYLLRTRLPENILSYTEQRRNQMDEAGPEQQTSDQPVKKKRKLELPEITVRDAVSRILARSSSKPKVPARYSLAQVMKQETEQNEQISVDDEDDQSSAESSTTTQLRIVSTKRDPNTISINKKLKQDRMRVAREQKNRVARLRYRERKALEHKTTPQTEMVFECWECEAEVFRTRDHIISRHLSAHMFTCEHCQYTNGCHRVMRRHSTTEHPTLDKNIAVRHDLEPEVIQKHQEYFGFDYRTARFRCQLCGDSVAFGEKIISHTRLQHLEYSVKCLTCDMIFDNVDVYVDHHDQEHPDVNKRYKYPAQIELQNACFPWGSLPFVADCEDRKPRGDTCKIGITCLRCGCQVPVYDATDHARGHCPQWVATPYPCPCCNFCDVRSKVVKNHIKENHPTMSKFTFGVANKKEILEENRELIAECFGFNMVECDYCKRPVSFWMLRPHATLHLKEFESAGQQFSLAQIADRCYGGVLHVSA